MFVMPIMRLIGFLHQQNWAVLTDESSYTLMKHHVLLAIQTKPKQAKFYYFSVAIDSIAKSKQAYDKSLETLKAWNAAISKYIQLVFYFVM